MDTKAVIKAVTVIKTPLGYMLQHVSKALKEVVKVLEAPKVDNDFRKLLLAGKFVPNITQPLPYTDTVAYFSSFKTKVRKCTIIVACGLIVTTAFVLAVKYVNYRISLNPIKRGFMSYYINKLIRWTKQPKLQTNTIRSTFSSCNPVIMRPTDNHTHGDSAAIRSSSSATIDHIANAMGRNAYFIQQTPSDCRKSRDGCRTYFWAKDVGVEYAGFNPRPEDIIAMVDVDMYIDSLPYMLSNYIQIYMISTFQPTAVACSSGEYSFNFDKSNNVTYSVSGGSSYHHQVWNYNADVLISVSPHFLGLAYTIVAYNVDKRQISPHHQIICLTPIKTFISPLLDLGYYLDGTVLSRLNVVQGDFVRMDIQTSDGRFTSTGKVDTFNVATIPTSQDDALATTSRNNTTKLSPAQVKTTTELADINAAMILTEYHNQGSKNVSECVFPVSESVKNYQFEPQSYDPHAKHIVTPFMCPFTNSCYAPDSTPANERRAVMGRVVEIRNGELPLTPKQTEFMTDFCRHLVPDDLVHTGVPVDQDELYLRQNRPAQKAILDRAIMDINVASNKPSTCFMKAETYGDVKDPRIITVLPPTSKAKYSQYVYAYSQHVMKVKEWYAFGKAPSTIAERVATICRKAQSIVNTDLSRYDGRVSNKFRILEKQAMLRFFGEEYHTELLELMQAHMDQRTFTRFSLEYMTWLIRLSGSPETADFNSQDNAYMAYETFRRTRINGELLTHEQAVDMLGIYGGDDGLTADINTDEYEKTCTQMGQQLEVEVILKGQPGVSFLSRQFSPYVWYGDVNSCCDIWRQVDKFHVTVSLPPNITPLMKFGEKLVGYYLTDKNTPVIGDLCRMVLKHYSFLFPKNEQGEIAPTCSLEMRGVGNGFSSYAESVQFPNESCNGWMMDYAMKGKPDFDFGMFNSWLVAASSNVNLLLTPPMCLPMLLKPLIVPRPVVINGELFVPPNKSTSQQTVKGHGVVTKTLSAPMVSSKQTHIDVIDEKAINTANSIEMKRPMPITIAVIPTEERYKLYVSDCGFGKVSPGLTKIIGGNARMHLPPPPIREIYEFPENTNGSDGFRNYSLYYLRLNWTMTVIVGMRVYYDKFDNEFISSELNELMNGVDSFFVNLDYVSPTDGATSPTYIPTSPTFTPSSPIHQYPDVAPTPLDMQAPNNNPISNNSSKLRPKHDKKPKDKKPDDGYCGDFQRNKCARKVCRRLHQMRPVKGQVKV